MAIDYWGKAVGSTEESDAQEDIVAGTPLPIAEKGDEPEEQREYGKEAGDYHGLTAVDALQAYGHELC